jgi:hypothetical protein
MVSITNECSMKVWAPEAYISEMYVTCLKSHNSAIIDG